MVQSVEPRNALGVPPLPPPEPCHRRTCARLAEAPIEALAAAAGTVLGDGNRTSLLLAAAAYGPGGDVERQARRAVKALLQAHKERLLEEVNAFLAGRGEPSA